MLAGEPPFKGPTPAATLMRRFAGPPRPLRPMVVVSEAVEKAIMRALDKEPDARFATVSDFLDALEGKSVAAAKVSAPAAVPAATATTEVSTRRGCLGMVLGGVALRLLGTSTEPRQPAD